MVGGFGGRGFLAALMFPSGVEEGVMFAVAAEVETDRGMGRSANRLLGEEGLADGLEGAAGDEGVGEGEGLSKAPSESVSASGVDALEAMARCVKVAALDGRGTRYRGSGKGQWRW
jgi:hypothetical protein